MTDTILITGTSSGLGRATAKLFQARGWNVIATMRTPNRETELNQLERVLVTRLDVQDVGSIQSAIDAGLARFGRIDAVVNNAAYGAYGPLEVTPLDKIRRQFDVNVIGLVAVTQALLPHFRAKRKGTIVNISSVGGRVAFPLGTLYHGTKFAVEGLSEALHYELAPLGIALKLVEPGTIATNFAGPSFDFSNDPPIAEYQGLVEALWKVMGPMMVEGSTPEQIAETVYAATTDGTDRLRYAAGEDAIQFLNNRRATDDASFFSSMRAQFGIGA
ncbi:SDR family oxidoreductase [Devosia sp. 1566]|uniref:SDR family oxidoreductase n=1 Tax=Devosia sp. 1566 TaxID=2499144 RepID=UPI000FDA0E43|nr:SDR family oxidoreductase [Devosia sp. 1566]